MKEIIYKIKFHSEWHCGSGLTSGSDLDALAVKDADGFPFIPGKTLKGLIQEAAIELFGNDFDNKYQMLPAGKSASNTLDHFIPIVFGYFDEKEISESKLHTRGTAFFSNAVLSEALRKQAKESGLTSFFYREIAATAIGENGIAKKHSLRRMETVIPCELVATISGIDENYVEEMKKCLKFIKRLGQNRHRGLGRCSFEVVEPKEEAKV